MVFVRDGMERRRKKKAKRLEQNNRTGFEVGERELVKKETNNPLLPGSETPEQDVSGCEEYG